MVHALTVHDARSGIRNGANRAGIPDVGGAARVSPVAAARAAGSTTRPARRLFVGPYLFAHKAGYTTTRAVAL